MDVADRLGPTSTRVLGMVILVPVFAWGYLSLNQRTPSPDDVVILALPFEDAIPFVPWLLPTYGLAYLMVAVTALAMDCETLGHGVRAFTVNVLVQLACFSLVPTWMPDRPQLATDTSLWHAVGAFWFWLDRPTNLFPSAHASMSLLAALVLHRSHRRAGWAFVLLAGFVGVSVVLVKQHYVLDVLAGWLLGAGAYMATDERRWQVVRNSLRELATTAITATTSGEGRGPNLR